MMSLYALVRVIYLVRLQQHMDPAWCAVTPVHESVALAADRRREVSGIEPQRNQGVDRRPHEPLDQLFALWIVHLIHEKSVNIFKRKVWR